MVWPFLPLHPPCVHFCCRYWKLLILVFLSACEFSSCGVSSKKESGVSTLYFVFSTRLHHGGFSPTDLLCDSVSRLNQLQRYAEGPLPPLSSSRPGRVCQVM